jgi:outer membrane immunogenic protein
MKTKKIGMLAFAGLALSAFSSAALAADMAVKAPPPAPAPVYTWTGFYAGLNVGYGWGDWDANSNYPFLFNGQVTYSDPVHNLIGQGANNNFCPAGLSSLCSTKQNVQGVFGGGQAGYNFQSGNIVYGIEGDIQASGQTSDPLNGDVLITNTSANGCHSKSAGGFPPSPGSPNCTINVNDQWELDWFSTVRGRIGLTYPTLGFPAVLFYGTGGVAVGDARANFTLNQNVFAPSSGPCSPAFNGAGAGSACPASASISDHAFLTGWTAGGGIEAMLDRKWSVKLEYLYMDLGNHTFSAANPYCTSCSAVSETYHVRDNLIRIGLNMKWG